MVALLLLVQVAGVGSARADALSVDELLSSLAAVLKDRAKQAVAEGLRAQIQDDLCDGTLTLTRLVARKPEADRPLKLHLGGRPECRRGGTCGADDQFVRSCMWLRDFGVPLADPVFLKELAKDTIRLGFRLATADHDENSYREHGFDVLADFMYAALELGARGGDASADLASLLRDTAENLHPVLTKCALERLPKEGLFRELLDQLEHARKGVDSELEKLVTDDILCNGTEAELLDRGVLREGGCHRQGDWQWMRTIRGDSSSNRAADCRAYFEKDADRGDAQARALFSSISEEGGHFGKYEDGCTKVGAHQSGCQAALLALAIYPQVARLYCADFSPDPARELRGISYVAETPRKELQHVVTAFSKLTTVDVEPLRKQLEDINPLLREKLGRFSAAQVLREGLATSLRLAADWLDAVAGEPQEAERWVRELKASVNRAGGDLRKADALSWDRRAKLSPRIGLVRDRVKQLLSPHILNYYLRGVARIEPSKTEVYKAAKQNFSTSVLRLLNVDAVRIRTHHLLKAQALILEAMATIQGQGKSAAATPTKTFSDAAKMFRSLETLSREAEDGNWLGVASFAVERASDKLSYNAGMTAIARPLRFTQALLSIHQAKSREEAQAMFESTLETASSRRARYDQWTLEFGALAAGAVGRYWHKRPYLDAPVPGQRPSGPSIGVFAPVGVQVAYKWLGGLAYLVDVGAYLRADGNRPEATDAFRGGLALHVRSRRLPVAAGVSGDYRPQIETNPAEQRVGFFIGVDLPLLSIY